MQVNISTMRRKNEDILDLKKNLQLDGVKTLFINQNGVDEVVQMDKMTLLVNTSTKGLSRSRNLGLDYAEEDIVLMGDDDLIYHPGFDQKIEEAFRMHPECSLICFKTNHKNMFFNEKQEKVNFMNLTSVYSVQVAFRKSDVLRAGIRFNEMFGAGSGMFTSGEENIFMSECLKKGLKCIYLPVEILTVPESESSWFHGFDEVFFQSKGALFYKLYGGLSELMFFAFAFLKRNQYQKDFSLSAAMKMMHEGRNKVRDLERGKS